MRYLLPKEAIKEIPKLGLFVLEVGFGNGSFLKWLCETRDAPVVGIDIANIAFQKARSRLNQYDVFLVKSEARFFLKYFVPPHSLEEMFVLFPDPWPKNKKRRLIDEEFAIIASSRLKNRGTLYTATDDEDYAYQMQEVLAPYFRMKRWELPVATKYMLKWKSMGRNYQAFAFVNERPQKLPFVPATDEVYLQTSATFERGMCVKTEEAVLKVDGVFKGDRKRLIKVIYSEKGFSHKFFFIQEGENLRSLNTWGEVFPPTITELIRNLK